MESKELGECKKLNLEIEKLQAEIRGLKAHWWIPSCIQIIPGILLVVATFVVTAKTGIFDARQYYNAGVNERIKTEQILLEANKEKTQQELADLRQQRDNATEELSAHRSDLEAIRDIQSHFPFAIVHFFPPVDGYFVDLHNYKIKLGRFDLLTAVDDDLGAALQAVAKLRNVRILLLRSMNVGKSGGQQIGKLHVERLGFVDSTIEPGAILQLAENRAIGCISFENSHVAESELAELTAMRPDIKINPGPEDEIGHRLAKPAKP